MHILTFTQQLAGFRSGVGNYAYSLISGLNASGHQLTVVTLNEEIINIPGVRMIGLPRATMDPSPGGWVALGINFADYLKSHSHNFDVAHFTDAREAWRVRKPTLPVTGMVNDSYALDWMNPNHPRSTYSDRMSRGLYYGFLRKMEGITYPRLDALIANSRHVCNTIAQGYNLDAAEVCVIHYGLQQPKEDTPLPLTGSPAIVFVGGNFFRKGLPLLMQAAASLRSRFPDIHLHVVGKDSNQPAIAALAAKLHMTRSVTFHGRQPNDKVRRIMAGADIFALPSATEGFGLVYVEAMQAGTPVIATRIGGAHEVFVENSEAVFVDPRDVGGLSQAIEKIASDKKFAQTLREGGRKAASRFTVDSMVKQTEALWGSIVAKGSGCRFI